VSSAAQEQGWRRGQPLLEQQGPPLCGLTFAALDSVSQLHLNCTVRHGLCCPDAGRQLTPCNWTSRLHQRTPTASLLPPNTPATWPQLLSMTGRHGSSPPPSTTPLGRGGWNWHFLPLHSQGHCSTDRGLPGFCADLYHQWPGLLLSCNVARSFVPIKFHTERKTAGQAPQAFPAGSTTGSPPCAVWTVVSQPGFVRGVQVTSFALEASGSPSM